MINSHTILKEQPAVLLHFLTNFCCGFLSEMDFQSGVSVVGGCSSYRRIPIRYFLLSSFFALTRASRASSDHSIVSLYLALKVQTTNSLKHLKTCFLSVSGILKHFTIGFRQVSVGSGRLIT